MPLAFCTHCSFSKPLPSFVLRSRDVCAGDVSGGTDTPEMVAHCAVVPGHREMRGPAGFADAVKRDEYIYEDCWRYMFTHPIASANRSRL